MRNEMQKYPVSHWPDHPHVYWSPMRRWMHDMFPQIAEFNEPDQWMPEPDVDWVPRIEMTDHENSLILRAELPGVDAENVSLTIQDGELWLRGERRPAEEETNFLCREQRYGSFSRKIRLPYDIDANKIKTSFKNGVLTLRMPKAKAAIARQIQIH